MPRNASEFEGFTEEDMETVELLRGIMRAAAGVICAVISYAITDSVSNGATVGNAMEGLGDEILQFMHEADKR